MENRLTPAEKSPEQIQDEMAQTRESLTEKVAALENQVVGSVQTAADTLTGTVDAVKSLMTSAPETMKHAAEVVSEKVREVFDISGHVRAHPWAAVGVSAGLGFLTGLLVFRGRESLGYSSGVAPPPSPGAPTPTRLTPEPQPAAPSKPGLFDDLVGVLGRKVREVAETVIDTATAAVNQNVRAGVPKLVDRATEAAAERLSPEAGGPTPRFGEHRG